jgi:hypothetical protein
MYRVAVAVLQNLRLVDRASIPNGADSVYHVSHFQLSSTSDDSLARWQRAALIPHFATFRKKSRASRPMNRAINTSAAEQGRVGGVHDRISLFMSDVAYQQLKERSLANAIAYKGAHELSVRQGFDAGKLLAFQKL